MCPEVSCKHMHGIGVHTIAKEKILKLCSQDLLLRNQANDNRINKKEIYTAHYTNTYMFVFVHK